MKIDPWDRKLYGKRFLNDKGIKKAIDYGFIKINPDINFETDFRRIQPATLDLRIKEVYDEDFSLIKDENKKNILLPKTTSELLPSEKIFFNSESSVLITPEIDARSSLRRLGGYIEENSIFNTIDKNSQFTSQKILMDNYSILIHNYSKNKIIFDDDERLTQMFFKFNLFKNSLYDSYYNPKFKTMLEKFRDLDMGIEITEEKHIKYLERKGHLRVFPKLKIKNGFVLIHASDVAYKIKKLDEEILFSQREKYADKIHETIKLKDGHFIRPRDHLDIKTVEYFKLSEFVGIHFYTYFKKDVFYYDKKNNAVGKVKQRAEHLMDGWADPGFEGDFSRQPKSRFGQIISPGDIIGYGKVIYYPNGVGRAYGSKELGSQYNKAKANAISK